MSAPLPSRDLLQSEPWARFQAALGRSVCRIQGEAGESFGFGTELSGLGSYLYFPRGPLPDADPASLRALGEEVNAFFVRIEPLTSEDLARYEASFGVRLVSAPEAVQPREVLRMDISPDEDAILASMKPKARYNLRLAMRKGVVIRSGRTPEDVSRFFCLVGETAKRKGIRTHGEEHYRKLLEAFGDDALIMTAYHGDEPLAALLLVMFGNVATYLHGGTGSEKTQYMAPYLLHFEAIRLAKERGCRVYDLGGIEERADAGRDWSGITRFKRSFAPSVESVVYPGTYDIVLKPTLYRLYRQLRNVRRHFRFL